MLGRVIPLPAAACAPDGSAAALALALGGRRVRAGGHAARAPRGRPARLRRRPRPRPAALRCSATCCALGHGSARPVRHAGGSPPGRRPANSSARPPSQNVCTSGSDEPTWTTWKTPTTMPSAPMKRVSRPARIALSETSTMPTASASAAGVSSTRLSCDEPGRRRGPGPRRSCRRRRRRSLASITRPTPSATQATAEQHAADDRQVEGPAGELGPAGADGGGQERHRVRERDEPEAHDDPAGDQLGRVVGDVARRRATCSVGWS